MNKNKFKIVPITILSVGLIITGLILSSENKISSEKVQAQSLLSGFMVEHIGGKTKGTGDTMCCNGIVLDFESQEPMNPWILDGEAIFTPGISESYEAYNEFDEGYCTIGKLFTFICLDPENECAGGSIMPGILTVGTSPSQCTGTSGLLSLENTSGFKGVPSGYLAQSSGTSGPGGSLPEPKDDSLLQNNQMNESPSLENLSGKKVLLYEDENKDCKEEDDEKDEDEKDDNSKDEDCETDEEHNEKYWGESHELLQGVFGKGSGPNGAFVPEDFQAGGAADPFVQLGIREKKDDSEDKDSK